MLIFAPLVFYSLCNTWCVSYKIIKIIIIIIIIIIVIIIIIIIINS